MQCYHGFLTSSWMGMKEMKAKVGKMGARMKLNGVDWSVADLFVDDTVLLAE